MNTRFIFDKNIHQKILVSNQTFQQLQLTSNKITLHFGVLEKELTIKIDNTLEQGTIILPKRLTNNISIPNLPYDSRLEGNHLFLGPVIGHLIHTYFYKDLRVQLLRFSNYENIKGLIFIFTTKTINMNDKTITGYYYNPRTKSFVQGTFPYPSVIYNRVLLKRSTYQHFTKHLGTNIFNYPFRATNKLLFWTRMSRYPEIKKHLPQTKEYKHVSDLLEMLKTHKSIYLKPVRLSRGRGILVVKKLNKGYLLSDEFSKQAIIKSNQDLATTIKKKFAKNMTYIIQQNIPVHHQGKKIDFRVYLQKDQSKNWKFTGIETKIAKEGSIITNLRNRKTVIPGKTALREIFHLNEKKADKKIKEITQLCTKVLKIMETDWGHIGDAAVDLIIDKNYKVWLLEVQLNYGVEKIAKLSQNEQIILPKILPTPLEYAKTLAGF